MTSKLKRIYVIKLIIELFKLNNFQISASLIEKIDFSNQFFQKEIKEDLIDQLLKIRSIFSIEKSYSSYRAKYI